MSNNVQLRIQVPFDQKDAAKSLGARWLPAERTWYVPHGCDIELFRRWWPVELVSAQETKLKASAGLGRKPNPASRAQTQAADRPQQGHHITGPVSLSIETDAKLPWED